jgi:hypothetical protein
MAIEFTLLLQSFHQQLKRQVLIGIGFEAHIARPPDQLTEFRVCREVQSQNQCIHEKTDQTFRLDLVAIGDWRTYYNVLLPSTSVDQNTEACQERHK